MNPWLEHVAKVRSKNPKLSYKECLVKAKDSYKKKPVKKGAGLVGSKMKKVKKGGALSGMLYKAGFKPNDHNTWDEAEDWLLDNGATQTDMKDFYKQIASKLQDTYTQQDWKNMGMASNIHDVEKLIKQPLTPESMDKEDAGDKSWLTGGKLKKVKKVKKGAGLISVKGIATRKR